MSRTLDRLVAWWALAGGVLLLAITLVTTTNAGAFMLDRVAGLWGRDVEGLPGYEDFVRLTVSAAALMFFPYCQLKRGHVAVDLFVRALPARTRRGLDRAWLGLTALLALFLCGWMAVGLIETRADAASSSILGWPEWPFYVPGVISLVLWAAVAARQCARGEPVAEELHGA